MTPEQDKLVMDNMRLVYYLFGKIHHNEFKYSHEDDFKSEGMIGLIKAAKSFDASKGIKFATYATRCINNEFFMYLRKLRKKDGPLVSLDSPIDCEGETLTLADVVAVDDNTMDKQLDRIFRDEERNRFVQKQPERNQRIIEMRLQGMSQNEVAHEMGFSQSYVSRLCQKIKKQFNKGGNDAI